MKDNISPLKAPASTKRRRGRPTTEMKVRLHQDILRTALQVFNEKGFGNATVQQICTKAGISLATFYRHFKDKDNIFSVAMGQFNEIERQNIASIHDMTLDEGLRHVARVHLAHMHSAFTIEAIRLIYAEAPRFPDLAREFLDGTMEWLQILMEFLRQHRSELTPKEAYDLAVLFMGMVGGRYEHEKLLGVNSFDERRLEHHGDLAVRIFVEGFRK